MKIAVTGGAGFIGSNFIRRMLLQEQHVQIVNLDKLTYAGNQESLQTVADHPNYSFLQGDICDSEIVRQLFSFHRPDAIVHFAAESHVDRSIDGPAAFIRTNINGTFTLLEEARRYWSELTDDAKQRFRFLHISTDEVYGSLGETGLFSEQTQYAPNSPYSASKAAADHLVRAYYHTYGLPVVMTNCSNNYGPYQFPEKLIPLMIVNAIAGKDLPIYGTGLNVRDWLYVADHCCAIQMVLEKGRIGEKYNIGGNNERTNIEVVRTVCDILDEMQPRPDGKSYAAQITFVKDRQGHDQRYAINAKKIQTELNWRPEETFETGMRKTVRWYLDNDVWCRHIADGTYRGAELRENAMRIMMEE